MRSLSVGETGKCPHRHCFAGVAKRQAKECHNLVGWAYSMSLEAFVLGFSGVEAHMRWAKLLLKNDPLTTLSMFAAVVAAAYCCELTSESLCHVEPMHSAEPARQTLLTDVHWCSPFDGSAGRPPHVYPSLHPTIPTIPMSHRQAIALMKWLWPSLPASTPT